MKVIHKKWKLLLYAASGMGANMLNLMMGSYLCSALLIGGFEKEPAAIEFMTFAQKDLVIPFGWMIFHFIAKVIDGVIDIPMASITDNLRTRWGRRRPSLIMGIIPMVAAYVLFLVIPDRSGATMLNTIYYGVVLCIYYIAYTLTMVTYYATYTEIVDNQDDRNFLANVKSVCDIIYFIIGYVVVRGLLNGMHLQKVALLVLPMMLTMVIPLIMIKEPDNRASSEHPAERVHLVKSLGYTFRNKAFIAWMVAYSFMTFGVQLFLGGINEYFSFVGMNMMMVMMASFAPVPFALVLYNKLIHSKGFGFAFRYTLIMYSLGMLSMFGVSFLGAGTTKTVLSIVAGLFSSFAVGALFAVAYSVPSQLAADEEKKTGVSNSAMYFAVQGLFAGVATGIATGVVLTALKESSGGMQYMTAIAALGCLVACAITYRLPKSVINMGKVEGKGKKTK